MKHTHNQLLIKKCWNDDVLVISYEKLHPCESTSLFCKKHDSILECSVLLMSHFVSPSDHLAIQSSKCESAHENDTAILTVNSALTRTGSSVLRCTTGTFYIGVHIL